MNYYDKILAALDTRGGMTTHDVAVAVQPMFGLNMHQHSGAVRSWLVDLEKSGRVRRLDNEKPACWVRVVPQL